MPLHIGDKLPSLQLNTTQHQAIALHDLLAARAAIIYFYPKNATPACTVQAQDFRDLMPAFDVLNCVVLGVSRDSMRSHEKFTARECLPFELISDVDETICHLFDVIKPKNMYGKQLLGIERSTFFFDAQHTLQQQWRNVNAKGHAAAVLAYVQAALKKPS